MHLIYRKEEAAKANAQFAVPEPQETRPLRHTVLHFLILVFATWGEPATAIGLWHAIHMDWRIDGRSDRCRAINPVIHSSISPDRMRRVFFCSTN